jgi:hypothetical protein
MSFYWPNQWLIGCKVVRVDAALVLAPVVQLGLLGKTASL